jgi:uncharacterized Fe-S cluster protein YjdI
MNEKILVYDGDEITVQYSVTRCIHAAECVRGLPAVFDPDRRPWIDPNAASAEEIVAVVQRCPTGALHFTRKDGGAAESEPEENTIMLVPDGPLYLRGNIEIQHPDGMVLLHDTRVALCRCGASKAKPFCDGSHTQISFQAE